MTSLVTDLLVNPVLRQARRFSLSRSSLASNPSEPESPPRIVRTGSYSPQDDTMSETEETESSLREDPGDSVSSRRSSQSSLLINPHVDVSRIEENHSQLGDDVVSTNPVASTVDACASDSRGEPPSANHTHITTPEPLSSPLVRGTLQDRSPLPEDDGMGLMRKRIFAIQAREIGHSEKAHLMHQLLMEGYTNSRVHGRPEQPLSPSSPKPIERTASQGHGPLESFKFWQNALGEAEDTERFALTEKDLEPTFVPNEQPTESIADIVDNDAQHVTDGTLAGFAITKLKITVLLGKRRGICFVCSVGLLRGPVKHVCLVERERRGITATYVNSGMMTPISLAITATTVVFVGSVMALGKTFTTARNAVHASPYLLSQTTSALSVPSTAIVLYVAITCSHRLSPKSLNNMESQFRNLEISIQAQPMPPEFKDTRAIVLCHDCSAKSSTMYHWLGLKCGVCQSYNTAQLQIIGLNAEAVENELVAERNPQASGPAPVRNPDAIAMNTAMGNTRRRHSSTVMGPNFVGSDLTSFAPDRLARSVSPIQTPGRSLHASMVGSYFDREEEEDDHNGDMFSFWRHIPRSLTSNHEDDDEDDVGGSSDDTSSDEDMEDDDAEESDDDDFELLGHR
ncbi:hypothetical protein O1611_g7818 [Lasiodiplodia mahajangana]|uniref:Uncharacterized protein n=1 Tax=Lasiodiplodia mahajangana TaxID=1108764 RepID=A0ACC2JEJ0_9PEZI|nr:hypothetical protein O1611_g7818 [Lasiodiplodia mahajangana]